MSFHDSDYNASDSDDTLNLQRRTLTRSLVAFDPRQAHSIYRAQGQPPLTNYGNVTFVDVKVYKPTQYNTGPGSSGAQGYLTAMSSNGDIEKQLLANGYESDPTGMFHTTKEPGETTPSSFIYQPADWFRPGRFFSIWAPRDVEIHDRKFILLDSKNTEGKGVRVKSLDRDGLVQLANSSSASRTTMGLKSSPNHNYTATHSNSSSSQALSYSRGGQQVSKEKDDDLMKKLDQKFRSVHMDEYAHQDVPPGTFILLEHTYNIPFVKYKCVDHGMLDDESLDILRFHYVQYLINSWRLTGKMRDTYSRR